MSSESSHDNTTPKPTPATTRMRRYLPRELQKEDFLYFRRDQPFHCHFSPPPSACRLSLNSTLPAVSSTNRSSRDGRTAVSSKTATSLRLAILPISSVSKPFDQQCLVLRAAAPRRPPAIAAASASLSSLRTRTNEPRLVAGQLGDGHIRNQLALRQDDDPVRDGFHFAHQVTGDEHRLVLPCQILDQPPQPLDAVHVQPVKRLIENDGPGSPSKAAAIPKRCRMPNENSPIGLC